MKKYQMLRYFILMIAVFFFMLFINLIIRIMIAFPKDHKPDYATVSAIKKSVADSGSLYITPDDDIKKKIILNGEFAMIISNDGNVVTDINKPQEIPDSFAIADVAAFSRWYLKDYPVYTYVLDDGILVIGRPKGSIWRYSIISETRELNDLIRIFPAVILIDLIFAILVPFFILKRQERSNEKERVQWISGVSHDIRTPLSLIMGNAQNIIDTLPATALLEKNAQNIIDAVPAAVLTEKYAAGTSSTMYYTEQYENPLDTIYLASQAIKTQTLRIKELVTNLNTENLLHYGVTKSKDIIVLSKYIRDITCGIMERDEENIYDVELEIDPMLDDMTIIADEGLIKRMLENLILNSMTHNPQGCSIKIMLSPVYAHFLSYFNVFRLCGLHNSTPCKSKRKFKRKSKCKSRRKFKCKSNIRSCLLTISDDGTGTDPETLNELNKKQDNLKISDHGLGLTVVKKIIALYHWKIAFESDVGFTCKIEIK